MTLTTATGRRVGFQGLGEEHSLILLPAFVHVQEEEIDPRVGTRQPEFVREGVVCRERIIQVKVKVNLRNLWNAFKSQKIK